jgi:hypothetical protein
MMINYCPECGHNLPQPIFHGITSCNNCRRVFDSSQFNKLLSAAWLVRKRNIDSEDYLVQFGYTKEEADLLVKFVHECCYSHEDFKDLLKNQETSVTYEETHIDLAS